MPPKTYSRHNCGRRHRSYATAAKCIWPRHIWIQGDGPYAVLSWCQPGGPPTYGKNLTVTLWDDLADAENAKRTIDRLACGGRCRGESGHQIVRLVSPGEMEQW